MPSPNRADRRIYAGLFTISLATLTYEILLTRIFSVTMWYHFAFMAISIAMFGLTVGGLIVHLHPAYADPARARRHLFASSAGFSIAVAASFYLYLNLPIAPSVSLGGLASIGLAYMIIAVPFVFSGISVCVALTKFPEQVSRLYAADLAGAALGCVLLIYLLEWTDGITPVGVVALLGCVAALLTGDARGSGQWRVARLLAIGLGCFVLANTFLVHIQQPLLRLKWTKGEREPTPRYVKWNSFSRITIFGSPAIEALPLTEGIGPRFRGLVPVRQLFLTIDSSAETTLTGYPANVRALDFLAADAKEIVYWLRRRSSTLIVGAGGGRDVLAALMAEETSIRAVEVNPAILDAVNVRYGDFTGHLDRRPNVHFINDEARSYIARQREPADIIQISFIDTWAATAAGGFALTENSLYTTQAWKLFLSRLTPTGILSVSRWYIPGWPAQAYRLVTLAAASLQQLGINDPRQHIIFVRNFASFARPPNRPGPGVGTILVSRAPFSEQDLDMVEKVARTMGFDILLSPRTAGDKTFAALATGDLSAAALARYPFDLSPPTDDRPFFFQTGRLGDLFRLPSLEGSIHWLGEQPELLVVGLLIIVVLLTALTILAPLARMKGATTLQGNGALVFYFTAIGLGFMLIEVSQMERLIVFLGEPTYALSVVLFTLLLASGLGSYLTHRVTGERLRNSGCARLLGLLAVLAVFGIVTPRAITAFSPSETPVRIVAAAGILFLLGLFMGMAFPLGMKAANEVSMSLTPWLWGINGAASVCGSVLALVIALGLGISTSFWSGCGCYAVALAAFVWITRRLTCGLAPAATPSPVAQEVP